MANTISNQDDVIDSRDVIARIDELEGERDDHPMPNDGSGDDDAIRFEAWREAHPEDATELAALQALTAEAEGYGDWAHGETLIRDSHFKAYAQELADDLGLISADARWPATCIDWEEAAEELKQDYTAYDFDGVTYWGRS